MSNEPPNTQNPSTPPGYRAVLVPIPILDRVGEHWAKYVDGPTARFTNPIYGQPAPRPPMPALVEAEVTAILLDWLRSREAAL